MSSRSAPVAAARNALLLAVVMVSYIATVPPAFAMNEIVTDTPPPPDRVEHAPPPRDGYVWGAGHWEWNGRAYTWISGTWIAERRAAHWVASRWEEVGTQWHYVTGHWER